MTDSMLKERLQSFIESDGEVKGLGALNDYLFSVNNSLFKTEINFIICYRDEMRLDADMFDSVQEYLDI